MQREDNGEEFAAKYLMDDGEISDDDKARFRKEVRLLRSLDHPNIVKVVAARILNEPYWYVLPLYEGNLRGRVQGLASDARWRFRVIDRILAAIEFAHENGVLHRDLKPENILFDEKGDVVVSDFGLGRQIDSESTRKTQTGQGMGTLFYCAPEQMLDTKSATERSDIYSLGRIIYEFCTGDPPQAPQDLNKLDSGFRRIVGKCTRQKPEDRYQSVADLRRDFRLIATGSVSRRREDSVAESLRIVMEESQGDGDWENLKDSLVDTVDNPDVLHETIMNMPPGVFEELGQRFPDEVRELVGAFCEHVAATGWSFGYCDKIARVLDDFYHATRDSDSKVALIEALFLLGAIHNRFYVIAKFKDYLNSISDPGEILAVRDMLLKYPQWTRMLRDTLVRVRIPEPIHDVLRDS